MPNHARNLHVISPRASLSHCSCLVFGVLGFGDQLDRKYTFRRCLERADATEEQIEGKCPVLEFPPERDAGPPERTGRGRSCQLSGISARAGMMSARADATRHKLGFSRFYHIFGVVTI